MVFISYKGVDESWAARVAETLDSFGVTVWRDHGGGLSPGDTWRPELEIAIKQSDHMVVLWSQSLMKDATSVAHQEINTMNSLIKAGGRQRFVPMLLDDASIDKYEPLAPFQGEDSLRRLYLKYGAQNADQVHDSEWYTAMLRLLEFFDVRNVVAVPYLVGAMTRHQALELRDSPQAWAQDQNAYEAVRALREKTVPFDPDQYGDTPESWRPFSHVPELQEHTIADLISNYDMAKRQYVVDAGGKPNWVLVSYSADLMSDDVERRKRARDAMDGKCLVILDPISLMHKKLYKSIVNTWGLQGRDNAFVIGLAACEVQMHADFRQAIPALSAQMKSLLNTTYDRFAEPFDPVDQCVLEVGHEHQFARWLQVAADAIIAAGRSPLRFGSMNPAIRRRVRSLAPGAPGAGLVRMGAEQKP
jgi:hypothetical protein